jgi:hypothetical protein
VIIITVRTVGFGNDTLAGAIILVRVHRAGFFLIFICRHDRLGQRGSHFKYSGGESLREEQSGEVSDDFAITCKAPSFRACQP